MHLFNGQSNTKMIIAIGLDLLMKLSISCFDISFVDGHQIQVLKSDEFSHKKPTMMVWGSINIKGLIGYHSLKTMMDGSYYIQDHLIPNVRREFGGRW